MDIKAPREVEIGMKVVQDKKTCEKILLDNGYEELYKTYTRDLYFAKDVNFEGLTEYQIKKSCIRCRNFRALQNLQLFHHLSSLTAVI